jgi:hypothetical protein
MLVCLSTGAKEKKRKENKQTNKHVRQKQNDSVRYSLQNAVPHHIRGDVREKRASSSGIFRILAICTLREKTCQTIPHRPKHPKF